MIERLSKNFLWMAAANTANGLIGIVIFIYLARVLLPESFGYLSYVLSIIFYLGNFVDLGLSTYGIREISRNRSASVSAFVSAIVSFKLLAAAILSVLVIIFIILFPRAHLVNLLALESCFLFFTAALATEWAFQGLEKMHMVFVSFFVTPLIQLLLLLAFVHGPLDLFRVPVIYVISAAPIIIYFLKKLGARIDFRGFDPAQLKTYLSSSLIIWAISICAQVYNNLDVVILGFFRTPEEVGYFTIARRVVGGFAFLTVFLANALLPRLSCTFTSDRAAFGRAIKKFLKLATAIVIVIFIPVIAYGKEIITFLVGAEYASASLPLSIMMGGLVLVLFNLPFSTGLIAACRERKVLMQVAASALLSVFLNIVLIPQYGMAGAAISFFLAEGLALIWIIALYKKYIVRDTAVVR